MIGMGVPLGGTRTGTLGEAPDADEDLLDDERAPPPREPLSRELTDAVEVITAEERTAQKPVDNDIMAWRFSSHSEI
jgi:hypothetical protein